MSTDDPDDIPSPAPYRPPAPSEGEAPTKVCPDCMTDPAHQSPGGERPIAEFRLVKAAGYSNGLRRAAYCRYHERERMQAYRAAKKDAALTPAQLERRRERNRKADAKRRATGKQAAAYQQRQARLRAEDPERFDELQRRSLARLTQWATTHVHARKAYRAKWYQAKVDREIAAGLRPPRGTVRRGGRRKKER